MAQLATTAPAQTNTGRLWWSLAGFGLLLNAGVLYLAASLCGGQKSVGPDAGRRIAVPFEADATLWEPFCRWVVQEDGRNKPFDTVCREAVRAITGREQFELVRSPTTGHVLVPGHDPVAVVVSWLLLYESDPDQAEAAAKQLGCDWEQYPFVWCRNAELRQLVYEDYRPGAALSEEDRFGHYVEPAALRQSASLGRLLREVERKRAEDGRAPLSPVERAAVDVHDRLELYDRIRRGGDAEDGRDRPHAAGEIRIAALDEHGPTWFTLASLRAFAVPTGATVWEQTIRRRGFDDSERYADGPPQSLPENEVREILNAFAVLRQAYRGGEPAPFAAAAESFLATVERVNRPRHPGTDAAVIERELWYNRANPFRKAWLLSLLASLLLAGGLLPGRRWPWVGRGLYGAGLLAAAAGLSWAGAGFYCRVAIAGRPPVGNMYESLIWVAFMTLTLGLVLESVYRRGVIALAAALVAALGFVLADQLPLTFSPSIQPLQAVLRSNYWLVVHVLTIVSSYAPFALAWGLGNLNLGLILFAPRRHDWIHTLSQFCYRAIQVGVLLLFAGTMLGGWWAAESWGRFWGWDPKEVWALVALLCYLIPLHARHVGWVRDFGLAVCSVVCFAAVVMAWYGVNFVLGAGLHSYGFGSGDDRWIYLAGLLNISLVVHGALRYTAGRGAKVETGAALQPVAT